jgi:hypothetical protein
MCNLLFLVWCVSAAGGIFATPEHAKTELKMQQQICCEMERGGNICNM